jgi:tetratricopeptide (TPR) repeat protein
MRCVTYSFARVNTNACVSCPRITLAEALIQTLQALKLAERTIQFADTLAVLTDGYIRAGRVCHAEGSYNDALKHYKQAAEGQTNNVLAAIGFAQMQLRNGERLFHTALFLITYRP